MNKKWIPHSIAIAALVVFIGLFSSCGMLQNAWEGSDEGGYLTIEINDPVLNRSYAFAIRKVLPGGEEVDVPYPITYLVPGRRSNVFHSREDGEYIVRYSDLAPNPNHSNNLEPRLGRTGSAILTWPSKTVTLSGGKSVTVYIP